MLVLMKTCMAGPDGVIDAGRPAELEKARAYDLVERGYAVQPPDAREAAVTARTAETATVTRTEAAVARPGKRA